MTSADPIDEAEAQRHFRYIRRAVGAPSDELRRAELAEGLLAFGLRFVHFLSYLAETEESEGEDPLFRPLADELIDLWTQWLGGNDITDRADEAERRAVVAAEAAERNPEVGALAASAILRVPEDSPARDLGQARALLRSYVEAGADNSDSQLSAIQVLLDIGPGDDAELDDLIARGSKLEPSVDDEVTRDGFRSSAAGACLLRAIRARDDGDAEAQHRWVQRGVGILGTEELSSAKLQLLATLFSADDDDRRAAETFARAVDDPEGDEGLRRQAAMFEARFRNGMGEHERVVELLAPRLAAYEESYLTAVRPDAIEWAGSNLGDVVINLAFSLAQLGRWGDALRVLDRGRSLRARYRAALRRSEVGTGLLALERDLYRLERGVSGADEEVPERDQDRIAQAVLPRTRLLEAYRRLRPRLPVEAVDAPSVAELAGVLAADEAAVVLGPPRRRCSSRRSLRATRRRASRAWSSSPPTDGWTSSCRTTTRAGWSASRAALRVTSSPLRSQISSRWPASRSVSFRRSSPARACAASSSWATAGCTSCRGGPSPPWRTSTWCRRRRAPRTSSPRAERPRRRSAPTPSSSPTRRSTCWRRPLRPPPSTGGWPTSGSGRLGSTGPLPRRRP